MTPCEKLGYKIGDRFEVICSGGTFGFGSVIELCRDDGDDNPYFKLVSGVCHYGDGAYINLKKIIKINNKIDITIDCPDGYEFDGIRPVKAGEPYLSIQDFKSVKIASNFTAVLGDMIALKRKQPDTIKFEFERVDGLAIKHGMYYTDHKHKFPLLWDHDISCTFKDDSGVVIWRLKDDHNS